MYENPKDLDKLALIEAYLYDGLEIVLNKEENLKNGDEVTATIMFSSPNDLNLKFTSDEITKSLTVSGLAELVESYDSVPDSFKQTIKADIEAEIGDDLDDDDFYSNLKVEQIGMYQKKYNPELHDYFEMMYLYKVDYDEKSFFSDDKTKHKSKYYIYQVDEFKKRGDALIYDIYEYEEDDATGISKAQNKLIVDGYEQIKSGS